MNPRRALAGAVCALGVVVASGCDPTKPPTFTIEVGKVITITDGDPLPTVRAIDRLDVVLTWSEDIYERCAAMGGRNRWDGASRVATCEGVDPLRYPLQPGEIFVRSKKLDVSQVEVMAPTTMYAPIPEPKTECDEHRYERPEPQGCYVPVPFG